MYSNIHKIKKLFCCRSNFLFVIRPHIDIHFRQNESNSGHQTPTSEGSFRNHSIDPSVFSPQQHPQISQQLPHYPQQSPQQQLQHPPHYPQLSSQQTPPQYPQPSQQPLQYTQPLQHQQQTPQYPLSPQQQTHHQQQQQMNPPNLMSPSIASSQFAEADNTNLLSPNHYKELSFNNKQDMNPTSIAMTTTTSLTPIPKRVDDDATLSTPPPPLLKSFNDYEPEAYPINNNYNSYNNNNANNSYNNNSNNNYNNISNTYTALAPASSSSSFIYNNNSMNNTNSIPPFDRQTPQQYDQVTQPFLSPPQMAISSNETTENKTEPKKRKRKNLSESDNADKPKRQRKSKKKKEMDDGVENVPTSSLGPDGFEVAVVGASEGVITPSKRGKKARVGKEGRTPRKVRSPEELEAAKLLKQQQRAEKKMKRKSKMMDGVNEVSSTVETSDPIMLPETITQPPIVTTATITTATDTLTTSSVVGEDKGEEVVEEGEKAEGVKEEEPVETFEVVKLPIRPKSKKKRSFIIFFLFEFLLKYLFITNISGLFTSFEMINVNSKLFTNIILKFTHYMNCIY